MDYTYEILQHFILWYFLLINSFYAFLLFMSIPEIYRRYRELNSENLNDLLHSKFVPPFTIITPAYNEEKSIVASVKAMLNLSYWHVKVIVVNDGSTDNTLEFLKKEFDLFAVSPVIPISIQTQKVHAYYHSKTNDKLVVIDKENGGKSDSLNVGINACVTPFFLAVDSDTLIEKDALQRMIRPVLTNKHTIAAGGTVRVVNNCTVENGVVTHPRLPRNLIPGIQVVEYLRAFLFGRLGWNKLGGNIIISGAFGMFNKEAVIQCGGYTQSCVGEDMELVVRMHETFRREKKPYRVEFIPDPVVWTEVPSTLGTLRKQRERWHRGLIDTLVKNRKMIFNPRYGSVGLLVMPFFLFGEMLSPIIEFLSYILIFHLYMTDRLNNEFAILFFILSWGFSTILTFFSILIEESTFKRYNRFKDLAGMIFFSLMENIGFRQCVLVWRLEAFWNYLIGFKGWGAKERKGFNEVS